MQIIVEQQHKFLSDDNNDNFQENNDDEPIITHPEHHVNILQRMSVDKLQINIETSLTKLNELLRLSQELVLTYHRNQKLIERAIQVVKLSSIALMQLNNIKQLMRQQDLVIELNTSSLNIICTKDQLNQYSTNLVLDYMNHMLLNKILEILNKYGNLTKEEIRILVIYLSKLKSCIEQIPGATVVPHNDLFSLGKENPMWQSLNPYIEQKMLGSNEQIKQSYEKVSEGILLGSAMISKGLEYNGDMKQTFMTGFGAVYYAFQKKKMLSRANHFMAEAKQEQAFKVWNLPETGMIKSLMGVIFPSITYNKKIYIPKLFKQITKESVLEQYKNNRINKITNDVGLFVPEHLATLEELFKKGSTNKVQVRILCHQNLQYVKEKGILQSVLKMTQGNINFEQVIIHIHGGGFVAMSSRSHQTYTRKWANNLQVPIFSIDYRMAPNNPYPDGVDDCWQAYMFILTFIHCYFNIIPKKIVLVGDSAGGNLCAALTVQAIKAGVRVPDGILLCYPALSLDIKQFTPSFLVSLDDSLLHHTVLKLCLQSYILPQFDSSRDPLISPSKASDEILSRFPKTRIMLGTYDPLHDESFRLLSRLIQLKRDASILEYQFMPHGFLSFDIIKGMKEAKQTVIDAQNILKDLLS